MTYQTEVEYFEEGDGATVVCNVGGTVCIVDMATFLGVSQDLADRYRAEGFKDRELAVVIEAALPTALAVRLGCAAMTRH